MSRTTKKPKSQVQEALAYLRRDLKRRLLMDGLIADPSKRGPRVEWAYVVHGADGRGVLDCGSVRADTLSQAKALIKKALGIKSGRLPVSVEIRATAINATTA